MSTSFVIERTYDAPIEKVWQAITNKDKMKVWYFNLEAFDPVPGFVFEFTGGPEDGVQYTHHCMIIDVVPGRKLSHTWEYVGYTGSSVVTFELFDEGNGHTRLRLTHAGLDTFPPLADFAKENFEAGWTQIVGINLKNYLGK